MSTLRLRSRSRGLGLSPRRRAANGAALPSIVQDGLVAEWRFDDGAGQVLTDYTGNGHHGRLGSGTGADAADPLWTAQGLSFDGGDFVECDNVGISGTIPRTLIAVMKRVSTNEFGCEWAGSGGGGTRMTLKLSAISSVMRMEYQSGGADLLTLTVAPDTWHFCGYTQSGNNANTGIGYLNGGSEALTLNRSTNTAGNFFWGRTGGSTRPMQAAYGLVYNRVLSPAEVEQNRHALSAILAPRGITLP
jgi:hypothetical protein